MLKAIASTVALGALLVAPAPAAAASPDPNPWLTKRFLNIAHQGGEDEAPSNTMFALRSAVTDRGADMIELDVHLTSDQELVVIHDHTVDRTTNGTGEVRHLSLAQIQALDAGYWFRPHSYSHDPAIPASAFTYRGVRTGAKLPPPGYTPDDFRVPTLREVLDAFPTTPINIEIKMPKDAGTDNPVAALPTANALAAMLSEPEYAGRDDIIVVSFNDALVAAFNAAAPHVALAPGIAGNALFALGGIQPVPDVAAFQVPPYQFGIDVVKALKQKNAQGRGYAIHVWPNADEPDGEAAYARQLAFGVDGYMSSQPGRLHAYLCDVGVPRPDGSPRCPAHAQPKTKGKPKKCRKAKRKTKKRKRARCAKKKKKKKRMRK